MVFHAASEQEQEGLGELLASVCPAGCVLYLEGELGAGKTTLVRGFLRGLGYQGAVKSPTYTLIEPYPSVRQAVYHLDLYRLSDPAELEYLGFRDILGEDAVLLVEWPERGRGELPEADLRVRITYAGQARRLEVTAGSAIGRHMLEQLRRRIPPGTAVG